MPTRCAFLTAVLSLGLGFLSGCSEDDAPGGRDPVTFNIPTEISFEEAAAQAEPGDTLLFLFEPLGLGATVTFTADQTPLVLRGNKNHPVLAAPPGASAIRFQSPKAGTRLEDLAFTGGAATVDVTGPGSLEVTGCRFSGGQVQLRGSGVGLTLEVAGSLFREPSLYGIQMSGDSRLEASTVTVADAGDCAIVLSGGARGHIVSSLLWRAANFGIACLAGGVYEASSGCNDVVLNGAAPYLDCAEPESDFHVDPQFCDAAAGDFTVFSTSPCSPDNSGGCGQVGAFLPACDPDPLPPAAPGSPVSR